ncbi:uncharacterized protein N7506_005719 [Penicillium brevicompactum]|uniref:uncharacterized protein n=1 Tax=Penicillium brevicompactum TaxID=5074 RepID=UPI002540FDBB|nr:uncharacterized protein N7506_005719 [Penicillium brevicompactum]KAJ5335783.1 hypothetical protein N7506_005719 [Penicillium brevicompactum]
MPAYQGFGANVVLAAFQFITQIRATPTEGCRNLPESMTGHSPRTLSASYSTSPSVWSWERMATSSVPLVVPTDPSISVSKSSSDISPTNTNLPMIGDSGEYAGSCGRYAMCNGSITYYDTATSVLSPSSCGTTNDGSSEDVVALPQGIMTDEDCGRTVLIKFHGTDFRGTVVDKCMGCNNQSLDLSRHLFALLAPLDEGRVHGVEWYVQ